MRIDVVNLYHLRMPLVSAFETSFGRIESRDCILIEIASEGLIGFGECVADRDPGYSYETTTTAWHILRDYLAPLLLDRDVAGISQYREAASRIRGHNMAKAGLEMALWDLLGKRDGRSLQAMLGGVQPKVAVGVSVGIQATPSALVDVIGVYLERGYGRIKIKIKPGRDLAESQAVRQAFPHIRLQVDANSAYTLETARNLLALDELDLLLIEQPLAEDDMWDHSQLQRLLSTPICLDESILSARHARQALEMKACRVINIKVGRVGGLSAAVEIHNLCRSQNIPVWCGGMLETGVGRAANLALASLPGFTLPGDISATERYYHQDITDENFSLNTDSTIDVPQADGLGITIDQQALLRFSLDRWSLSRKEV
jgi:O-succinylbenzoate synthase